MVAAAVSVAAILLYFELTRLQAAGRIPRAAPLRTRPEGEAHPIEPLNVAASCVVVAVVTGVIGARIFHLLDKPEKLLADPWRALFSPAGGLTFYGALIPGCIALAIYVWRTGIPLPSFFDALAPPLAAAYGLGRLGCHLAGDGDWGIMANLSLKPAWLPTWLWAETYPGNVLGVILPEPGVYPTPLYEFLASSLLFAVLWANRRSPRAGGWMFSLYLTLAGVERILIEQIRVNRQMELFGLSVSQAELLSAVLIVLGVAGLIARRRR